MSRLTRLFRRVEPFGPLVAAEKTALEAAFSTTRRYHAHQQLFQEGASPDGVKLIVEGMGCRYKMLPDGRRQIVGFLLPGDICDVRAHLLDRMDYSAGSFGPLEVAVAPPEEFQSACARYPRLLRALSWCSLVDESLAREWLVNIGHRSAFERMAHLFCELYYRLEAVGLMHDASMELPLTQIDLADSLALSPVHVNRTLMELRRSRLLSFQAGVFTVHDLAELQSLAGFDPRYLHLGKA